MIDIQIEYDKELGAYHLTFNNNYKRQWDEVKGFIDVIKRLIPASDRSYNPITKVWTIAALKYEQILEPIINKGNFSLSKTVKKEMPKAEDFFYNTGVTTSTESKESLAGKLINLLDCKVEDLAEPDKLKKLYRKKAFEFHPDKNNGDGSRMSELNSIWSAYNA